MLYLCCDAASLLHIQVSGSVTNARMLTFDNKSKYPGVSLLMSWAIFWEIVVGFSEMHAEAVAGVVDRVINRYKRDPTCMLQILRQVQESCDWIPPEAIDRMQAMLGVPRTKIEGVAGFYSFIYTEPRGKYRVLFSDNITDRMQGNRALMERLCSNLWVERGKVSEDGLVSVGKTACTGLCDPGPGVPGKNFGNPRSAGQPHH